MQEGSPGSRTPTTKELALRVASFRRLVSVADRCVHLTALPRSRAAGRCVGARRLRECSCTDSCRPLKLNATKQRNRSRGRGAHRSSTRFLPCSTAWIHRSTCRVCCVRLSASWPGATCLRTAGPVPSRSSPAPQVKLNAGGWESGARAPGCLSHVKCCDSDRIMPIIHTES